MFELPGAGRVVMRNGKAVTKLHRPTLLAWFDETYGLSRLSLAVQLLQLERILQSTDGIDNTLL